jgi:hypothetical protein
MDKRDSSGLDLILSMIGFVALVFIVWIYTFYFHYDVTSVYSFFK